MRNWINAIALNESAATELDKARALMRSGRKILFHSGLSSEAESIGHNGLEPNNSGAWVKEVAMGGMDADEDEIDEILSKNVAVVWMSTEPEWVNVKANRSAGNSVGVASGDVARAHAHLALIDAEDYADDIFYVGDEGLSNGPYSTVWDVHGAAHKFHDTDLYAYDDENGVYLEPYGVERNEWISAAYIDVSANLIGEDVLTFLKEFFPSQVSKMMGER